MSSTEASTAPQPTAVTEAVTEPRSARLSRFRWLIVLGGLIGAGLAWWVLETHLPPFPMPEEMAELAAKRRATIPMSPEEDARLAELSEQLDRKNAAAAWAVMGASIASAVGIATGLVNRRPVFAIVGLLTGAVLGVLAGGGVGWVAAMTYQALKIRFAVDGQLSAMAAHSVGWIGLAVAMAFAAYAGSRGSGISLFRIMAPAIAGAIMAVLIYPLVAAFVFPFSNNDLVIPTGYWNRLVWIAFAATLVACGIVSGMAPPKMTSQTT